MKLLFVLLGLFLVASASNDGGFGVQSVILRAYQQYSSVLSSSRKASSISDPVTRELYKELPLAHFNDNSVRIKRDWNQLLRKKVEEYRIHKGKFSSVVKTIKRYYRILFDSMDYVHRISYDTTKAELLYELTRTFSRVTNTYIKINEYNYVPITLYIMISLKDQDSNKLTPKTFTMQESSSFNEESADGNASPHEEPSLKLTLRVTPKPDLKLILRTTPPKPTPNPTSERTSGPTPKLASRIKALQLVPKQATDSSFDHELLFRNSCHYNKRALCVDTEVPSKRIRIVVPNHQLSSKAKELLDPTPAAATLVSPCNDLFSPNSGDFSPYNQDLDVHINFINSEGPDYDPSLNHF